MKVKRRGWIISKAYPEIENYLSGEDVSEDVKAFFDKQPLNVLKFINWERKVYAKASPYIDPIKKTFIPTSNPDIFYILPKKKDIAQKPIFFSCPKCNGRLFSGMKHCGWCGCNIKDNIQRDIGVDVIKRLFEFISPSTQRPPLAKLLSSFTDNSFIDEINNSDFEKTLKDIDSLIPVEAYVK